jgi:hypothetical protein
MFTSANCWGSCRPQSIPGQSSRVDFDAEQGIVHWTPDFGGCGFGQNAGMEVATDRLLERVGGEGRGGRIVAGTMRGGRCRATSVSSGYGYRVKVTDQCSYEEVLKEMEMEISRPDKKEARRDGGLGDLGLETFLRCDCMPCRRTDDAVGGSPSVNLNSRPWKRAGLVGDAELPARSRLEARGAR